MKPAREIACECVHPDCEHGGPGDCIRIDHIERLCDRVAAAIEAERAEVERLRALIDPAVVRASKYLIANAEAHPEGCCAKCCEGLADRDRLREVCRDAIDWIVSETGADDFTDDLRKRAGLEP